MFNNPLFYIFTPVILAIILNLIIYSFKWNKNEPNPYLPPGYVIGIVWIIIFGLLGYAYYLILNERNKITLGSISIILMILFCLLYPFLTGGFNNKYISRLLNMLTLIFSIIVGFIIFSESKYIYLYIIPLILWSLYVNITDFLGK
jgi:tryptophan-rich sensory protein